MAYEYEDGDLGPDFDPDDELDSLPTDDDENTSYNDPDPYDQDESSEIDGEDENSDEDVASSNNDSSSNDQTEEDNENSSAPADEEKNTDENGSSQEKEENDKLSNPEKSRKLKLTDLLQMATSSQKGGEKAKEIAKEEVKKRIKKKATKTGLRTMLMAGGPSVFIVILILMFALLLPMIISAIFASDEESMISNSSMTSQYFYGMRTAYIDDTQLIDELQLSYKNYVVDILDAFDNNSGVSLQITLPQIEDNSTQLHEHILNMSTGIGSIVAKGSADTNANFVELYAEITHFGLTASEFDLTHKFLTDYVSTNSIAIIPTGANIEELLLEAMNNESNSYMLNVCEKVMIKDYLPTEESLDIADSANFIASIYMPKQQIVMTNISYRARMEGEEDSLSVKIVNNNETLLDFVTPTPWSSLETIDLASSLTVVNAFTCIDTSNPEVYKEGVSLFEAIKLTPVGADYFKKNEEDIYTYLPNQDDVYYILFNSANGTPFQFKEYNLEVVPTNFN